MVHIGPRIIIQYEPSPPTSSVNLLLVFTFEEFHAVRLHFGASTEVKVLSGDEIHGFSAACVEMSRIFVLVNVDCYQNSFVLGASLEDTLSVGENQRSEIAVIQGF